MLLGIIGGTGFTSLPGFIKMREEVPDTPWGPPAAPLVFLSSDTGSVVFLARHGADHTLAPHRVNYRANIAALKMVGIARVIALTAVGGINRAMVPGMLVAPHQLIDYTWGREHTFYDGQTDTTGWLASGLGHIDFTRPFSDSMRARLAQAANRCGIELVMEAVYGVTQGPRLETAAEIDRMETDGADLVGMTAMPEAALARELGLEYALLSMVVNEAAGRGRGEITMDDIYRNSAIARDQAVPLIGEVLAAGD